MGNSNSGRGGLPRAKRLEIERLIAARWKNAHIARHVGCDVSTVTRIKHRVLESEERGVGSGELEADTVQCGGCGGQVLVSVGYCIRCFQEKTVFAAARRERIARIARNRHGRRSQKARLAA